MSREKILKQRCERFRTIIKEMGNRIYREDGHDPISKYVNNGLLDPSDLKYLSGFYSYESTLNKDKDNDYYYQLLIRPNIGPKTKEAIRKKMMEIKDKEQHIKPPLGVIPRDMWDRKRQKELAAAMERYLEAGEKIPKEWIDEYSEIIDRQEQQNKTLCVERALQDLECSCDCTREFISKYGPFTPDEINTLVDKEKEKEHENK